MYLSLLLSAVLAQTSPLASFHPTDADVYLEVADPAALAVAMRNAPLLDTVRDPAVQELVTNLTGGEAFDLDALLDQAWQQQLPAEARGLLEGLEGLSLSLRVPTEGLPDALLTARFADPAQADALLQLALSEGGAQPLDDAAWEGAVALPDDMGLAPWLTTRGAVVVVGTGALRDAGQLARLAGGGGESPRSLANHALLTKADEALGTTEVPTLVHGFFRRSPITVLAELLMRTPDAPLEPLMAIADQNLLGGTHRFRMGFRGDRYVTEVFTPDAAEGGALGVAAIDPARAAAIPTDLLLAYATTLDGKALGASARQGLELFAAQSSRPDLPGQLEEQLGFAPTRIFGHLGTQLTIQSKAVQGLGLPETAIWVDLADVEAFTTDLATIVEKVPALMPGFRAEQRDYRVRNAEGERVAYPITSLGLPEGMLDVGLPITVEPSLTIADGRLLVGLSSIHVKRELKRLYGDEPVDPEASNPWGHAGFALPAEARSATFVDWGRQVSGLVSLAKLLGPMAGDAIPFDLSQLPDGEELTRHMRPTVDVVLQRDGGIYRFHEASFGPETWVLPVLAVVGMRTVATTVLAPAVGRPVTEPAPVGFATEMALQQVRAAITIYRADRDELPAELDDLLATSDAFPQGYLAGGRLPADAWGNTLVYQRTDDGYRLYSTGPNGQDEDGGGDDVELE